MTTPCLHCGLGESFYRRESSIHFSRVCLPLALGKSVSVCLFAFTCWVFIFVNFNLAQFNLFTLATRKETVTQGGGSECESQLVGVHCGGHNRLTSPLLAMASFPLLQLFASLIKEPKVPFTPTVANMTRLGLLGNYQRHSTCAMWTDGEAPWQLIVTWLWLHARPMIFICLLLARTSRNLNKSSTKQRMAFLHLHELHKLRIFPAITCTRECSFVYLAIFTLLAVSLSLSIFLSFPSPITSIASLDKKTIILFSEHYFPAIVTCCLLE